MTRERRPAQLPETFSWSMRTVLSWKRNKPRIFTICCEDIVCDETSKARHWNIDFLFDDKSSGPGLRRLEEVEAFDELFEWNPKAAPDPECGWNRDFEMVGGRIVCCPSEHERPPRWRFDIGSWDPDAQFDEAEVEHPEFD